jgi:CDP-6-deoxy-D-xylo-4-hexulose-3-dehydrase
MRYKLSDDTWGQEEIEALKRVTDSGMFTMGENVERFEAGFAEKFGSKHAVMVSSGSAANLIAIASLVYSGKLKRGDEVIVPAVSWSTTYFPLAQMGLRLRFVDVDLSTLNMDAAKVERAVTRQTKMIFAVNLLGNPSELEMLQDICDRHGLILAEDNCEAMGGRYKGKCLGTFGLFGTFSTFYSHHISTMEGGVVVTDDTELYHYMLSVRSHGWTRHLPEDSPIYEKCENPFYESFHFIVPGFNLRPIEMEAAAGIEQLKKLDGIVAQRRENAAYFKERMRPIEWIGTQRERGESSWFGFALLLKDVGAATRDSLVGELSDAGIDVRPIVAGNFARNPVIRYLEHSCSMPLDNADDIHANGFFVGNHSKPMSDEIDYLAAALTRWRKAGESAR